MTINKFQLKGYSTTGTKLTASAEKYKLFEDIIHSKRKEFFGDLSSMESINFGSKILK